MSISLEQAFRECPVVAILRGVSPEEVVDVAQVLYDAGIRIAEVPLNRPNAFDSIARLSAAMGERMLVGAGTVLDTAAVERVVDSGGRLCVAPNVDTAVIEASLARGAVPMPGFQTVTEAFTAIKAGARWLKYFPAVGGLEAVKAMREVLPTEMKILAVGGVDTGNVRAFLDGGFDGVGIGGGFYKSGRPLVEIGHYAQAVAGRIAGMSELEGTAQ
ncbi:2-dehydro-3-deoxy-6-phosphogalactonate aldolase [Microbulbifer sp. ALW1]|uniref:2-dehydro-3-deoxy-6-phosphogalactonate aldolase n=1 Tax=Microbulbifer sp. (strain ALW1) TaxID=1516059 RepID=UPI001357A35C|nr:2-dehydro-3-deoxy-6-phosphogalactonate aldolase [Microbulbifer sp. ALW1]